MRLGLAVLALVLVGAAFAGPQAIESQALLGSLKSMYAPTVLAAEQAPDQFEPSVEQRMWVGGWLTAADPDDFVAAASKGTDLATVPGADKIFYSDRVSGGWSRPQLCFQKTGFHVNDPLVLQPPSEPATDRSRWLYMYYTALPNAAARASRFAAHAVGLASSVDGGRTWTDRGFVIRPEESGDGKGAWSPGALVVGEEIWVYYHTGTTDFAAGITFRQRFALDGSTRRGPAERLELPEAGLCLSNLDVARCGDRFVMVANTLDLKNVNRYVSKDGVRWSEEGANPLIEGGPNALVTPHLRVPDDGSFAVYFGFDQGAGAQSVHAWAFAETCGVLGPDRGSRAPAGAGSTSSPAPALPALERAEASSAPVAAERAEGRAVSFSDAAPSAAPSVAP